MPPDFKKNCLIFFTPLWNFVLTDNYYYAWLFFLKKNKTWLQFRLPLGEEPTWNPTDVLPAELPRVIHVGAGLDVAFVRVIDGGGSGVGSSQDEYKTVQTHRRRVFVI